MAKIHPQIREILSDLVLEKPLKVLAHQYNIHVNQLSKYRHKYLDFKISMKEHIPDPNQLKFPFMFPKRGPERINIDKESSFFTRRLRGY